MAKITPKPAKGKQARSKRGNYEDHERNRAMIELTAWAMKSAQRLGAQIAERSPPEENALQFLRSDHRPVGFWDFIDSVNSDRNFEEFVKSGTREHRDRAKPALQELTCAVDNVLASLSKAEQHLVVAAPTLAEALLRKPLASVAHTRKALEELRGDCKLKLKGLRRAKNAPRKPRGVLIRDALRYEPGSGGWWPEKPSDTDFAALTILTGVAFEEFESDFGKRDVLATRAKGKRPGQRPTHLEGFVHNEKKRCRSICNSISVHAT